MDNFDLIDEALEPIPERKHLKGIPRQCKHCKKWARYERPKGKPDCWQVECRSCGKGFDVVFNMIGGRQQCQHLLLK